VTLLGFCDSHADQVRAACGRRMDMCGYTSVPEDGRTSLSDRVVSAETLSTFKARIDKFWSDEEVMCNCKADLRGIGNN